MYMDLICENNLRNLPNFCHCLIIYLINTKKPTFSNEKVGLTSCTFNKHYVIKSWNGPES